MDIRIEGDGVKVLGGGTQAYNKDNRDKRRPLIMTSPAERQKKIKLAKDPIYKDVLKEIEEYKAEIEQYEEVIKTLEAAHAEELDTRHEIIQELEAKLAEATAVKAEEAKPAPKTRRKTTSKKTGD